MNRIQVVRPPAAAAAGASVPGIRLVAFGTHPTLTIEPYTMLADFVFRRL